MVHSYRKIILKDLKNRFASLYICVVKCAIAIFAHDLSLNFCEMERAHHKSSFVRQHLYQIQNITTYIFLNSSILIQKDLKNLVISKVRLGAEQNFHLWRYFWAKNLRDDCALRDCLGLKADLNFNFKEESWTENGHLNMIINHLQT